MNARNYSPLDHLLINLDSAIHTVFGLPATTGRPNPAADCPESTLTEQEQRISAGLMRVNHAGEVAAQALYQGQALSARLPEVRDNMERAALEENDHLAWCEQRLQELDSHTSVLNPCWYIGSFAIGSLAGLAGDKWSLGFVLETERQVIKHLEEHLVNMPKADNKSRAILEQMKTDELHHATIALKSGAAELPEPIKQIMSITSKLMTKTAYYL